MLEPFSILHSHEPHTDDHALAKRHAPVLYFDRLEPFLPVAVGYTVFTAAGESPSFGRTVQLPEGVTTAIEYAVWWDWDIQHLYELEHLWVYLDVGDNLVLGEGSVHGGFQVLKDNDKTPSEHGRLVAYAEPGKHAFAGHAAQIRRLKPLTKEICIGLAGSGEVLINDMFSGQIQATALQRRLSKRYMQAHAAVPSYDFSKRFDLQGVPLVTWDVLKAWIPERVNAWLGQLEKKLPHLKAVLLDSGDTILDESTEVHEGEIVVSAALIPTADAMMQSLSEQGYTLALVADGHVKSFENALGQHGLYDLFDTHAISETVGASKPDQQMFLTALNALGIEARDYPRTVMVGNHLGRDIRGANALEIKSVWLDWSPRRSKIPADKSEKPTYTIHEPKDLLGVLDKVELELAREYLRAGEIYETRR